jgi:glycosyltransferase involved in cell wall biosynthesis
VQPSSAKKTVLFVSGIDFKEKSIQVIRKTPEAYHRHGWQVEYLVGRDYSRNGDYFYEPVINPAGVNVHRFATPMAWLDELWNNSLWKALAFRIRNLFLVLRLAAKAMRLMRRTNFDIIYGYELYGVLALRLARFLGVGRDRKFVIRFQGVYAGEWERRKQWYRGLANWDYFYGLRTEADLCIMTNDGTSGDVLLKKLGNTTPILFYVNGTDEMVLDPAEVESVRQKHFSAPVLHFVSVSRLVPQKRVDRSIRIVNEIIKLGLTKVRYSIIGSGAEHDNLVGLITELGIPEWVVLIGSVKNTEVKNYLACADFFLSMDRISNVGNPLLEAVRSNRLIVTLNNGDTGSWIQHKVNGLIYDLKGEDLTENDYQLIASDIAWAAQDSAASDEMKRNLREVADRKLWTWEKRMNEEIRNVNQL